jgi:hypothetical protein
MGRWPRLFAGGDGRSSASRNASIPVLPVMTMCAGSIPSAHIGGGAAGRAEKPARQPVGGDAIELFRKRRAQIAGAQAGCALRSAATVEPQALIQATILKTCLRVPLLPSQQSACCSD